MSHQMGPLTLFNTTVRRKVEFHPVNDPVALYCCGPTVYNYSHIGNLRTYVFEDVLKRSLRLAGYRVHHVVNITDVGHLTSDEDTGEDKMEKGALREGKSVWDIAARFTQAFMDDIAALNILPADKWPKATDHIQQMIEMVIMLESQGYTYTTSDGIYFDTAKFPSYVEFAQLDPDNLRAGERVNMGEKRAVTDFALWKFSPKNTQRQMEWDSPWGRGFPGWHIECSAMSLAYLPQPLDIHCGGSDHIRVHHTNEIAQSEAATGRQFVCNWLHGEFLVMEKGKMAKSAGNFITLSSLKEKGITPLAYRMFCFSAHYRSPLTFSWEGIAAAEQSLANMKKTIAALGVESKDAAIGGAEVEAVLQPFYNAVKDDMNMPRAVAALWEIIRDTSLNTALRKECVGVADSVLGLDLTVVSENVVTAGHSADGSVVTIECGEEVPEELVAVVVEKIDNRKKARASKDWATADKIREQLAESAIVVKDLKDGSVQVQFPVVLIHNQEKRALLVNSL